jgi:WD40 repeat protein
MVLPVFSVPMLTPRSSIELLATGEIALSPDESRLALVAEYGQVRVLDGSSGALVGTLRSIESQASLSHPFFSSDGTRLFAFGSALGSKESFLGWWATVSLLEGGHVALSDEDVRGVALAPPSHEVFVAGKDRLSGVDLTSMAVKSRASLDESSRALAVNGSMVVSAQGYGPDSRVVLYDRETGDAQCALPLPDGLGRDVVALAFSPDGQQLAATSRNALMVWESSSWRPRLTLAIPAESMRQRHLAWSPDGRLLLLSGGQLRVFRVDTGVLVAQRELDDAAGHFGPVRQSSAGLQVTLGMVGRTAVTVAIALAP